MIEAFAILLVCQLVGEVAVTAWTLPVPGPVIGMVLLVVILVVLRRVPASLDSTAQGLLRHLSLLFVPAAVGVMAHVARLQQEWLAISVALLVSTVLTIAVTATVFRLVAGRMKDEEDAGS